MDKNVVAHLLNESEGFDVQHCQNVVVFEILLI